MDLVCKCQSCDVAKEEVKQILTGKSKNCSGLVSAAMTTEEAKVKLETRWLSESKNGQPETIVSIKNGAFYTIQPMGNGKYLAFRGKVELSDHTDVNRIHAVTTVWEGYITAGELEFELSGSEELMHTIVEGQTLDTFRASEVEDLEINDEDITVIRTQEDLVEFMSTLQ